MASSSPNRGEHKQYLKPPPSVFFVTACQVLRTNLLKIHHGKECAGCAENGPLEKNIQNLRVKGLPLLLKYTPWKTNGDWTYSHHPWKERKRIWTKHPGNYVVNLQGCAPKLNLIRLVQRSLRSQAGSCCESFIMEKRGQPEIRGLFVLQSFRENCVRTPKLSSCSNLSDHHKMTLKINDFKEIPRMEYLPTFTINLSQI